ncbi:hypothetical protein BU24DRAFT_427077 [Aaosphaeria arxii CBS 175.79]|uniref:Uncharacterized protein n=1 Tax=Aaosphaeria arxii CBS 175.79 TaxID=1450172 RepID=A0A6A5XDA5_9PLEO|nr:uncharacterized protein BU24DRAFT_427077 [Aaosphaeria arxii CBS 175.79]KAF2010880.1 hypothetical protein BU24DRAFT_427077 [Aaosphaeria arxii CBS 175.79]
MGFAIHPALIVLCVMLGAALMVTCGAGVHRMYGVRVEDRAHMVRSVEQESYMREVRDRNLEGLMHEGRRSHFKHPRPPVNRG